MLYYLATRATDEISNTHHFTLICVCALLLIILSAFLFFLFQKGAIKLNTIGHYFKFIKMENLYKSAREAYNLEKYLEARDYLRKIDIATISSESFRHQIEQLVRQVDDACAQKERNDCYDKITDAIFSESYAYASKLCDDYKDILPKESISAYQSKIANSFFSRLTSIISEGRIDQAVNELYELLSKSLVSQYAKHIRALYNAIHSAIDSAKNDEAISAIESIIYSEKIKRILDNDSLEKLIIRLRERYKTIINSLIHDERFNDARSYLLKYQSRLSEDDFLSMKSKISSAEAEREKRIDNLIIIFRQNVDSGKIEEATKLLDEIEKSKGEQTDLRKYKKNQEDNLAEEKRQNDFNEAILLAIQYIDEDKFEEAEDKLAYAKQIYEARVLPEVLKKRLDEYKEREQLYQTRKAEEDKMFGLQSLLLIEPTINVAKKINAGEDSDPYVNVDINRNWGVLGVFDGLGGAGARKYIHKQNNEEHTSAYWASRIVRGAIESFVLSRPLGKDPFEYLEKGIHVAICHELDAQIDYFPQAQLPLPSKMMAKLPTTMVLGHYQISNDTVRIRCLWAGDSRAYLLTKDSMFYLTVDDTDANDMDPFSPENMDMAMTNKISQDKSFYINVSDITVHTSRIGPIALIVATDGCFDYYRNPIAFEIMLRETLNKSLSESDWSNEIKTAIINNIQQDDFSMAIVALGTSSFNSLKEVLVPVLHNELYSSYSIWENSIFDRVESIQTRIQQQTLRITDLISVNEEKSNRLKEYQAKESEHVSHLLNNKEFASRYSISSPSIESDSFLQSLRTAITNLEEELTTLRDNLETAREDLKKIQVELEKEQLAINDENITWYHRYKEGITVLPISNKI